jgi:hypothetical protein
MSQFRTRKSFGPRISLTDWQMATIEATANEAKMFTVAENCHTGSAYIRVYLPAWQTNIHGEWYLDTAPLEIAEIRLSGHDEGKRQDSTHNVVGSKGECLAAAKKWLAQIIAQNRKEAERIAAEPHAPMAGE